MNRQSTIRLLCTVLLYLSFGVAKPTMAAPIYFTFDANVTAVTNPGGSLTHTTIGEALSYTIMVDFSLEGTRTSNGVTTTLTDTINNHFFYADFIAGDIEPLPYYGFASGDYEANSGYNFISNDGSQKKGTISVGDNLSLTNITKYVSDWTIGDTGNFFDYARSGLLTPDILQGTWTLTAISDVNPVPVPATIWLLGSGLIALFGMTKRKAKT